MRYRITSGKIARLVVDEEIDLSTLPAKFAALRTMPAPTDVDPGERARLEALYPVEQYDNEQHGPGLNINRR